MSAAEIYLFIFAGFHTFVTIIGAARGPSNPDTATGAWVIANVITFSMLIALWLAILAVVKP